MRELKFRGWCIPRGEMLDIQKISFKFNKVMPNGWNMAWDSENFELMQYIGFKDKLGVEIYEGDIVGVFDSYAEPGCGISRFVGHIKYGNGSFYIVDEEETYSNYRLMDLELTVIGNIYENPERLSN